ncbi:MAG: peptide chain release factor N(5)-glutamine methyltransferase [Fimbriimonadia bacterium]|jgi:release factor glutamine methyltransferase
MYESTNIRRLVADAATLLHASGESACLEAEVLAAHVLGMSRSLLLAHMDDVPPPETVTRFYDLVARRAVGEPLPYILGYREFYGRRFRVTPATLIPRPETELLVDRFLKLEPALPSGPIADVGTGCGCILACALLPNGRIGIGTDLSDAALQAAAENLAQHGLSCRTVLVQTDLLRGVRNDSLAAVLANLPYVAEGDPRLEAQVAEWEPPLALYSGLDGLSLIRRLLPQAAAALKPGGALILEVGIGQADEVARLLSEWHDLTVLDDLAGIPRVVSARK